jgi:hypothetical protein
MNTSGKSWMAVRAGKRVGIKEAGFMARMRLPLLWQIDWFDDTGFFYQLVARFLKETAAEQSPAKLMCFAGATF